MQLGWYPMGSPTSNKMQAQGFFFKIHQFGLQKYMNGQTDQGYDKAPESSTVKALACTESLLKHSVTFRLACPIANARIC